jgi:nicotinamidase-related amidase
VPEHSPLDLAKSALVIMDVQPSIVGMVPDDGEFVARIIETRRRAREAGVRIAYVRVALTEADAAAVPARNLSFSASAASGRLDDSQAAVQIDPRLAPTDSEIVVRKSRVGAFSTTNLQEQLEGVGVDTLILCGISTSGVVLSTVRAGADKDFRLFVVSDLCFDPDPEVHRVLTEKVFPRQATVLDAAGVHALFEASSSAS